MEEEKMENSNENQMIVVQPNNENPGPALSPENQADENYFNSFPPGYRFKPTNEELIVSYLQKKINNQELQPNRIHRVDIYKDSPTNLSARYVRANEGEWYFFSPREKKYKNGSRPSRAAGIKEGEKGFWKATGADRPIKTKSNQVIGSYKTLVYYEGSVKSGTKTNWIMKEYKVAKADSVPAPAPSSSAVQNSMQLDDCVLYKIYKKPPPAPKDSKDKNSHPDEEVNEDQPASPIQAGHQDQPADLINHNYENQPVDQVSEQHYGGDQIFYNSVQQQQQQQQHHQVQPADQVLEQHYYGCDQNFYNGAHYDQHQQIWSTPSDGSFSNNMATYSHNNIMLGFSNQLYHQNMPAHDQFYLPDPTIYIENNEWFMEDVPNLDINYLATSTISSRGGGGGRGGDDLINQQYLQSPTSTNNRIPSTPQMQQQQQQQQESLNTVMPASTSNPINYQPYNPESLPER